MACFLGTAPGKIVVNALPRDYLQVHAKESQRAQTAIRQFVKITHNKLTGS